MPETHKHHNLGALDPSQMLKRFQSRLLGGSDHARICTSTNVAQLRVWRVLYVHMHTPLRSPPV